MTITKTIKKSDNVFATLTSQGKTLKSIMGCNFSDMNEIIKMLCSGCSGFRGLTQLNVRNQSQGWCINMLLRIDNRHHIETEQPRDGLQYRLAF